MLKTSHSKANNYIQRTTNITIAVPIEGARGKSKGGSNITLFQRGVIAGRAQGNMREKAGPSPIMASDDFNEFKITHINISSNNYSSRTFCNDLEDEAAIPIDLFN